MKVNIEVDEPSNYNFNFINEVGVSKTQTTFLSKGINAIDLNTEDVENGFYILTITNENGETINTSKIIKE